MVFQFENIETLTQGGMLWVRVFTNDAFYLEPWSNIKRLLV